MKGDEMKIVEIINAVDRLNANQYTTDEKIGWLNTVDAMIKSEIIDTHEGAEDIVFEGYNPDTDTDTQLLVSPPYSDIYKHFLDAQIYLNNSELNKYNNSIALYNNAYMAYQDYYNRTHMPIKQTDITVY